MNMKMKKIFLVVLVSLAIPYVSAQNVYTSYVYKGEQIQMPINQEYALVYFNLNVIDKDDIGKVYAIEKEVILDYPKSTTLAAYVIELPTGNYNTTINTLKTQSCVYDVEPVIGDDVELMISNVKQ